MKKVTKTIIICASAVIILAALYYVMRPVIWLTIISGVFNPPISEEQMEKNLDKDYDLLTTVTDYLENSGYESVSIFSYTTKGEMTTVEGYDVKIEDAEVVKAINSLRSRGYSDISKDSGIISFQKRSVTEDCRGIAYSMDGSEPTSEAEALQYLIKVEPMAVPNWYYYEINYNEWRLENP